MGGEWVMQPWKDNEAPPVKRAGAVKSRLPFCSVPNLVTNGRDKFEITQQHDKNLTKNSTEIRKLRSTYHFVELSRIETSGFN